MIGATTGFVPPSIVVGVDGSPAAERATHWGRQEATGRELPLRLVTLETGVDPGQAAVALLAASRGAAMLCVGDVGLGSALVAGAHCPVAVVRGERRRGWVVAQLDESPDSAAVLQTAAEEARLRDAPLRVLGVWQPDDPATFQLDRRIESWRRRYPDLDVEPVAMRGSPVGWLSDNDSAIALVVIGARDIVAVTELLGPTALPDGAVLIVDRQRLL